MNFTVVNYEAEPPSEIWDSDDIVSYQVGNDTILFAEDELPITGTTRRLACQALEEQKSPYFVVQKGGSFEQENPDIEILYNRGRHLFVALSEEEKKSLRCHNHVCWHFEPLNKNGIVLEFAARGLETPASAEARADLAGRLSKEKMHAHLEFFAELRTRFTLDPLYEDAAEHALSSLNALGLMTERQKFEVDTETLQGETQNIIGRKAGTSDSPRVVHIVGHLDSINRHGVTRDAPGADDNGSGATGVLMLAEALAEGSYKHDIVFVLFGGEEIGLLGSQHFVGQLQTTPEQTLAVLNMDMIGRLNTDEATVLLEGAEISRDVIEIFAEEAMAHTDLIVEKSFNPFASDHVPFIKQDYPALLTIEGGDSSNMDIHTEKDTLEVIDFDYMQKILVMNLSAIERILGHQ